MAKKRTAPDVSRDVILQAAVRLVRRLGSAGVTVGSVAAEAGCAKGLVHYHFETKQKLWEAAAVSLAQERLDRWPRAFEAGSPSEAIEQTWDLLVEESVDGTVLAWTSLLGPGSDVPGLSTSHHISRFGDALGNAIGGMLARHDVRTRVSSRELGWLLASVISGVGFLLLGGADRNELEDAYAAAWIGILSLTE
ncbi:MAG: TetR/AcrR family transcriptional regulator [Gemmatimonadales bacterium]|jgi:AcrR family transcriptional regulator|nr:TetR/AcrR family transcriptional regulator [Gemmatimonadales bacterium]